MEGVDGRKDAGIANNLGDAGNCERQEPHQHDRSKKLGDGFGALPLKNKENHENHHSQRNGKGRQPWGGNSQALCGGKH